MKVRTIIVLPNLMIACFDEAGQQIPELQQSVPELLAAKATMLERTDGGTMNIPTDKDYGDFIGGKDLMDVKPDVPVFVLSPGRYYSRVAFASIPKGREYPQGGDMLGLLWRYDSGRTDYWYVGVRYRYYEDPQAFSSSDRKSWHIFGYEGPEEQAARQFEATWKSFADAARLYFGQQPSEPEFLRIDGDWVRFQEVVQNANPGWMHFQLFRTE